MVYSLQQTFYHLVSDYSPPAKQVDALWAEITLHYGDSNRHYHGVAHLENLLGQLLRVQEHIEDWPAVLFAMFYHDIVYDTARSDNEEKSADWAVQRMQDLGVAEATIARCHAHIIATQSHLIWADSHADTAYFLDADLAILGQSWPMYAQYSKQIRQEYARYPDDIYQAGRAKVLRHMLGMDKLFKSDYFYQQLEEPARRNIVMELAKLVP